MNDPTSDPKNEPMADLITNPMNDVMLIPMAHSLHDRMKIPTSCIWLIDRIFSIFAIFWKNVTQKKNNLAVFCLDPQWPSGPLRSNLLNVSFKKWNWDINRIFLTNREFYINIENRIFHINRITMNNRRNSINSQNGYNW